MGGRRWRGAAWRCRSCERNEGRWGSTRRRRDGGGCFSPTPFSSSNISFPPLLRSWFPRSPSHFLRGTHAPQKTQQICGFRTRFPRSPFSVGGREGEGGPCASHTFPDTIHTPGYLSTIYRELRELRELLLLYRKSAAFSSSPLRFPLRSSPGEEGTRRPGITQPATLPLAGRTRSSPDRDPGSYSHPTLRTRHPAAAPTASASPSSPPPPR